MDFVVFMSAKHNLHIAGMNVCVRREFGIGGASEGDLL